MLNPTYLKFNLYIITEHLDTISVGTWTLDKGGAHSIQVPIARVWLPPASISMHQYWAEMCCYWSETQTFHCRYCWHAEWTRFKMNANMVRPEMSELPENVNKYLNFGFQKPDRDRSIYEMQVFFKGIILLRRELKL